MRALLLAFVGAGCGDAARESGPDLGRLERLAFVPAGQLVLNLAGRGPLSIDVREALFVDAFEVTRAQWFEYQRTLGPTVSDELATHTAGWTGETGDWPASFMTVDEAAAYAASVDMRLPTALEWIFIAAGPQGLPFPWGATDQRSIANTLELGLERPVPVGTFEAGRTPQRVYDLVGNVAEWASDIVPDRDALPADERVSALGGSFRNRSRAILDPRLVEGQSEVAARPLPHGSRADDIGFRCVVSAAEYLLAHLPTGRLDAAARARWEALGRRWGRRALPLLEELAARPNASVALDALIRGARG